MIDKKDYFAAEDIVDKQLLQLMALLCKRLGEPVEP